MHKFTEKEIDQIISRGSLVDEAKRQLTHFEEGFPYLKITKPATVDDGIIRLNADKIQEIVSKFDQQSDRLATLKFVPASGVATRMFKDLFAYLDKEKEANNETISTFFENLKSFAFYDELSESFRSKGDSLAEGLDSNNIAAIISELLHESGMAYGSLPKALLSFHRYNAGSRTPLEEHLVEGAEYAKGVGGIVKLHLTVSEGHQEKFETLIADVLSKYEQDLDVRFDISFSQQKQSTDTLALGINNEPFLDEDGSILFRPAGHGALLENLNDLDADLIFIKNIDNVLPDRLKEETTTYKKALAGKLIEVQQEVFQMLEKLDTADVDLEYLAVQVRKKLFIDLGKDFKGLNLSSKKKLLKQKLHRPIRVCGMVKNTGESGGGPFWVLQADGTEALQIVETAQINEQNRHQVAILKKSTHFNPVDLVCATRDKNGRKFNLLEFRDDHAGFISQKSKNGQELKALELPGLWNGAMADWITLFVEVPISTFNPVKTVNDLLKDEHQ